MKGSNHKILARLASLSRPYLLLSLPLITQIGALSSTQPDQEAKYSVHISAINKRGGPTNMVLPLPNKLGTTGLELTDLVSETYMNYNNCKLFYKRHPICSSKSLREQGIKPNASLLLLLKREKKNKPRNFFQLEKLERIERIVQQKEEEALIRAKEEQDWSKINQVKTLRLQREQKKRGREKDLPLFMQAIQSLNKGGAPYTVNSCLIDPWRIYSCSCAYLIPRDINIEGVDMCFRKRIVWFGQPFFSSEVASFQHKEIGSFILKKFKKRTYEFLIVDFNGIKLPIAVCDVLGAKLYNVSDLPYDADTFLGSAIESSIEQVSTMVKKRAMANEKSKKVRAFFLAGIYPKHLPRNFQVVQLIERYLCSPTNPFLPPAEINVQNTTFQLEKGSLWISKKGWAEIQHLFRAYLSFCNDKKFYRNHLVITHNATHHISHRASEFLPKGQKLLCTLNLDDTNNPRFKFKVVFKEDLE